MRNNDGKESDILKNYKVTIISILSVYSVFVIFLFISSFIMYNKELNRPFSIESDKVYEDAIKKDKEIINKYRKLAKTNEEKECLNSIDELIDYAYDLHHPTNVETFKDYYIYVYGEDFNDRKDEKFFVGRAIDVINKCNLKKDGENKKEFTNGIMGSMIYYTENVEWKLNTFKLGYQIDELILKVIVSNDVNAIKKRLRQTPELLYNDNQIKAFDAVLKEVGERYEN